MDRLPSLRLSRRYSLPVLHPGHRFASKTASVGGLRNHKQYRDCEAILGISRHVREGIRQQPEIEAGRLKARCGAPRLLRPSPKLVGALPVAEMLTPEPPKGEPMGMVDNG